MRHCRRHIPRRVFGGELGFRGKCGGLGLGFRDWGLLLGW
jgi:hypothetical protein